MCFRAGMLNNKDYIMEVKNSADYISHILLIINLDAKALNKRIQLRKDEYLMILSLKRTRAHFKDIFRSKYDSITIDDLKFLSEELILSIDNFYFHVNEMKWYLEQTQDMPKKIEDAVSRMTKKISKAFTQLELYLNVERRIESKENTHIAEV